MTLIQIREGIDVHEPAGLNKPDPMTIRDQLHKRLFERNIPKISFEFACTLENSPREYMRTGC